MRTPASSISRHCLRRLIIVVVMLLFQLPVVAGEKPNIVFILADDLGIGDVECYGGDRCLIETPNIDALADSGMKFTDAHVNASICGPTRRAIMTGRYNWRFGPTIQMVPGGLSGHVPGQIVTPWPNCFGGAATKPDTSASGIWARSCPRTMAMFRGRRTLTIQNRCYTGHSTSDLSTASFCPDHSICIPTRLFGIIGGRVR